MNKIYLTLSLLIISIFLLTSCSNKKATSPVNESQILKANSSVFENGENTYDNSKSTEYVFPYKIKSPSHISMLPASLLEISSLSYKDGILYATNDEKGDLYKLDPRTGDILEKQKFGKKGDYEGVEITKSGEIYVLKSNGDIYLLGHNKTDTQKFKTELSSTNNVEGLGYLPAKDALLLACKGSPTLEDSFSKKKDVKAVYSWSIKNKKLDPDPHLLIKDSELLAHFKKSTSNLSKSKKKKRTKRLKSFSPSCIAYNEIDNKYYLLSTVGKLLVVTSANSKIAHIEFLDDTYFTQPEGICFDKDNNMYVSNEGKGLIAKILKFERD